VVRPFDDNGCLGMAILPYCLASRTDPAPFVLFGQVRVPSLIPYFPPPHCVTSSIALAPQMLLLFSRGATHRCRSTPSACQTLFMSRFVRLQPCSLAGSFRFCCVPPPFRVVWDCIFFFFLWLSPAAGFLFYFFSLIHHPFRQFLPKSPPLFVVATPFAYYHTKPFFCAASTLVLCAVTHPVVCYSGTGVPPRLSYLSTLLQLSLPTLSSGLLATSP